MTSVLEFTAAKRKTPKRTTSDLLRRFRPSLAFGYQDELNRLVQRLQSMRHEDADQELASAVETADARRTHYQSLGLTLQDLVPTLQWGTALRVLRDLHKQGWIFRTDDEGLFLRAPGTTASSDPETEKETIRRSFAFARDAQLSQPSVVRFIRRLERRGVRTLFSEGAELAERLRRLGPSAVQPELEVIERSARDPATGLLLQEIWRYARHFWSIPYQSTPGRNIFYLVRDAAVDGRPLIGIAALGNTVLGLAQRDEYAGWNAAGLQARWSTLSAADRRRLATRLLDVVAEDISETFSADIWSDGIPDDWRVAVAAAERVEDTAEKERADQLSDYADGHDEDYVAIRAAHTAAQQGGPGEVNWGSLTTTALYRRKRAGTLAALARAQGVLTDLGAPNPNAIERALETEAGVRAVETALRRIKQRVLASNVMELITCGAVPPYRDLLGGKLVALLMLSRTVVEDYHRRYSGQVSLIASGLAGRPIVRPANLAWLTTSSLYAHGSSQYNRLRVPAESGDLRYERIGITQSFGTIHFAPDTVLALGEIARLADANRRRVTNLFGEGTSPKMRLVRAGLDSLGLDSSVFLRHHSPRLLYGASLCSNLHDLLTGLSDEPSYILPSGQASIDILVDYWRERWLERRVKRPEILARVAAQDVDGFLLGRDPALAEADPDGARVDSNSRPAEKAANFTVCSTSERDRTFIQRLYRGANSYADRLSQDELDGIHVDLGVDQYLLEQARRNKQIVVTGNPGDGKTHLIERLRPQLEATGATVITDANAVSDSETLSAWRRSADGNVPFVLAINEWPLYVLHRTASDFAPVQEALRQVQSGRFFVDAQAPCPPEHDVLTIDLALRNLLVPSVVAKVVERLTDARFYAGFDEGDPILASRMALLEPQVVERLSKLLEIVGRRLHHVTMRQLVGFVAFLLTAGKPTSGRLTGGQDNAGLAYFNLAFDGGVGPLFNAVRQILDPASLTHPTWDERLWSGETKASDWLFGAPAPVLTIPSDREAGFRATKRRFLFEHSAGDELFHLVPHDEVDFEQLLERGAVGAPGLVRDLVLAINRFYDPDLPQNWRERLLLWQSHRYDVRAPTAFVSLRDLSHRQLRVETQRYAQWVEAWLPQEQRARQNFALVARLDGHDIALMEVDRELFLTLLEARRGLGRASWSRTATRRITGFVDQVERTMPASTDGVEDLRIRNIATSLDEQFAVLRQERKFQI